MRHVRAHSLLPALAVVAAAVTACVVSSGSPQRPPPPRPMTVDNRGGASHPQPAGTAPITDEQGTTFQIDQGAPGDPAVVGCADGQREAFVDAATYPAIAGCIAEWSGAVSMRTPGSGAGCGDDLGDCGAPADACAPGWHLCGDQGQVADLLAVAPQACEQAGGGRFVAALSHCKTQSGCEYEADPGGNYECFAQGWCSEPVCCGSDCANGSCTSGIWADHTHIAIGTDQGCGAIGSSRARGVLCCRS